MATPGQQPKPVALRLLEGNPGKRPIPETPQPPPERATEPRWADRLPGRPNARLRATCHQEWSRIVPVLDHLGLLTRLDTTALVDYCVCWARLVECERQLARDGLVVEVWQTAWDAAAAGGQGAMVRVRAEHRRHSLSVTVKEYRQALRAYVAEFGLGPSSRSRINISGGKDDDGEGLYDT